MKFFKQSKSASPIEEACLLSMPMVMRITGKSRSTVIRWEQNSVCGFPKKIRIGPNSIAWRREDIVAWLESLPQGGFRHD